jgi:beta-glucosidase
MSPFRQRTAALLTAFCLAPCLALAQATPPAKQPANQPWMNKALDPDTRADLMIHEMTLDEKIQLVHGIGWGVLRGGADVPANDNGGAGMVVGIPRLGLPDIQLADSAVGARGAARDSRYATLLPSVIGMAASWDEKAAHLYGQVIGRELRDQGYNMSIGGGVDLIREPRNGRNFEYASEDPLLSGIIVGHLAMGVQSQQVMGDIKHYVLNDQETGRNTLNAVLNMRALQETDLLAFNLAIHLAKPAGVMCSYNRVNGDFACENDYTLNKVLKQEWDFKGFVLSDWDGTHSTVKAALNGLDMEQPGIVYFGAKLKEAVEKGEVPQSRLDDMVHRIVRSMFAVGVIDNPPSPRRVTNPFEGRDDARHIEEESIVLLQNKGAILPLKPAALRKIVLIGAHADIGVLSGGGSAQVDAPGGNALDHKPGPSPWNHEIYFPSVPLKAVEALDEPGTSVTFDPGTDPASAAAAAKDADVVLFFADQWMSEGMDKPTLGLPRNQDAVIAAVAGANPRTVVILETGGPVSMPWAQNVAGIVESWFPGIGGAEAIADVLFGKVNPSGKLPVTFPATEAQLPHPHVTGLTEDTKNNGMNGAEANQAKDFTVDYNVEGMAVGYKWFQEKHETPLFPFGFGLSYTTFAYSNLRPSWNKGGSTVRFDLTNTGTVAGDEIAQVYVTLPSDTGEPFRKLAGFKRVSLAPGASTSIEIPIDNLVASTYSTDKQQFTIPNGESLVEVGGSSANLPLRTTTPKMVPVAPQPR